MNYTTVNSPTWANQEKTIIDCIVNFDNIGPVPFTANPLDTGNLSSKIIYNQCVDGDYGAIGDYVPPPTPPAVTLPAPPTKEELLAQLQKLQEQINSLE